MSVYDYDEMHSCVACCVFVTVSGERIKL